MPTGTPNQVIVFKALPKSIQNLVIRHGVDHLFKELGNLNSTKKRPTRKTVRAKLASKP